MAIVQYRLSYEYLSCHIYQIYDDLLYIIIISTWILRGITMMVYIADIYRFRIIGKQMNISVQRIFEVPNLKLSLE